MNGASIGTPLSSLVQRSPRGFSRTLALLNEQFEQADLTPGQVKIIESARLDARQINEIFREARKLVGA
jgi:hypothetical protein